MAFEIIPLKYEDLSRVYADDDGEGFGELGYRLYSWPKDLDGHTWAIDTQRNLFLLRMPTTRQHVENRYLFGMPGGIFLLRQKAYCKFEIFYASAKVVEKLEEVKDLIREAFRIAGEFVDGTTGMSDSAAVPNAEFF